MKNKKYIKIEKISIGMQLWILPVKIRLNLHLINDYIDKISIKIFLK